MIDKNNLNVAIIGGGPAGLMAADVLCAKGFSVDLYDSMPSLGRKFLMAGKSGLNLTHAEAFDAFSERFVETKFFLAPILDAFPPSAIRAWATNLGVETFVGTSGRVFPTEMKAAPLLRAWLRQLRANGLRIHVHHKWVGWDEDGRLMFDTPDGSVQIHPGITVLALGGASWPKLGSDGAWVEWLGSGNVSVAPLKPANCGFEVDWSDHLRQHFQGQPLKGITMTAQDQKAGGECMMTDYGLEGGPIYVLSGILRDTLEQDGSAKLEIDLIPDIDEASLVQRLSRPRGKKSMATHLKRTVGLSGIKSALLYEGADRSAFNNPAWLAGRIKALPLALHRTRPIAEAISTAGGITWSDITESLELKSMDNVYVAGEMLDWDAPTGGYLLSACFATGKWVGEAVAQKLSFGSD
jgi:uncharacterized flavoprotein (TIGR03862 family)